jgi:hypothetical protein
MSKAETIKGFGTTMTFKTSGWLCQCTGLTLSNRGARDAIETTHFESPQPQSANEWGAEEWEPGSPDKPGTLSGTLLLDPNNPPPWRGDNEDILVELPKKRGYARGMILNLHGHLTDEGVEIPLKGVVTQTFTIQLSGVQSWIKAQKAPTGKAD